MQKYEAGGVGCIPVRLRRRRVAAVFTRRSCNFTPPVLYRFNRCQSATVSAELAPGKTIAQGVTEMRRIAGETLQPNMQTALTGPARDFVDSSNRLVYVIPAMYTYLTSAEATAAAVETGEGGFVRSRARCIAPLRFMSWAQCYVCQRRGVCGRNGFSHWPPFPA